MKYIITMDYTGRGKPESLTDDYHNIIDLQRHDYT